MNRYTVVWVKSAEDELVELWIASSDRSAVAAATHEIDRQLTTEPALKGEPLTEGLRRIQRGQASLFWPASFRSLRGDTTHNPPEFLQSPCVLEQNKEA